MSDAPCAAAIASCTPFLQGSVNFIWNDNTLQVLPHSRADVDAGTGGVRAREVKSCALLRMDLGRV